MPNWCFNTAEVTRKNPAMLKMFSDSFDNSTLFSNFFPLPEGRDDWYEWAIEEWGTKWDIESDNVSIIDANNIQVFFQSAWSPPIEAYSKLETMGFKIRAMYHEPGAAFCGMYEDTNDECYDYTKMTATEIKNTIPEELDEMFNISEYIEEWEQDENNELKETL